MKLKEYKYRVLVYPNITKKYNEIHKDSYIVLLPFLLDAITKLNPSIHFTVLNPIHLYSLEKMKNVKQLIYNQKFSSNNNQMRTSFFFDGGVFMDVLNYEKNDFDVIYSHLPEHTLQLTNLIYNQTHSVPKVIGYSHWFDFNNASPKNMSMMNFIGILEMETLGVNSDWLKEMVMKKAKKYFNKDVLEKLNKIIQPHYLGIDNVDFKKIEHPKVKTIVYNHRGQEYMGFNFFCKAMDKLWEKRKDFRVRTFQKDANCSKYEWADFQKPIETSNRTEYFNELKKSYLGVGCFKGTSGGSSWSIATTDGLSLGIPYVLPKAFVYPHFLGEKYPLFYKHKDLQSFIDTIDEVLDNPKLYEKSVKHFKPIMKKMMWKPQVNNWMDWDEFFNPNTFPMVGEDTSTYKKVLAIIKKHKYVSKQQIIGELNWGKQFKFGKYRNRLRLDNRIRFTDDGYEWID